MTRGGGLESRGEEDVPSDVPSVRREGGLCGRRRKTSFAITGRKTRIFVKIGESKRLRRNKRQGAAGKGQIGQRTELAI